MRRHLPDSSHTITTPSYAIQVAMTDSHKQIKGSLISFNNFLFFFPFAHFQVSGQGGKKRKLVRTLQQTDERTVEKVALVKYVTSFFRSPVLPLPRSSVVFSLCHNLAVSEEGKKGEGGKGASGLTAKLTSSLFPFLSRFFGRISVVTPNQVPIHLTHIAAKERKIVRAVMTS